MAKRPLGAISTEQELREIHKNDGRIWAIDCASSHLGAYKICAFRSRGIACFNSIGDPLTFSYTYRNINGEGPLYAHTGYLFKNFWHAWAYRQSLLTREKQAQ